MNSACLILNDRKTELKLLPKLEKLGSILGTVVINRRSIAVFYAPLII